MEIIKKEENIEKIRSLELGWLPYLCFSSFLCGSLYSHAIVAHVVKNKDSTSFIKEPNISTPPYTASLSPIYTLA